MATTTDKVKALPELAILAEGARAAGRTVVLAHGTFDLLHLGHVRHLEAARREGDLLVVTITADAFVNKGPGRPVFNQNIRAEMLAALGHVDYVGIVEGATAEPALEAVRPSVYVKGNDYSNPEDDVTGKITHERNLVESHGGRMVFTNEVTFSSSSLINRHLEVYDPPLRDFLNQHRQENALERLGGLVERASKLKVLMVGDTIIDEYQYVLPQGKSPKENMIATRFQSRELFAGGVVAAANHTADFCAKVEVLSLLGEADSHEELVLQSLKPNVTFRCLTRAKQPTTRKCRFIDQSYLRKLFEVYHMDDTPLSDEEEESFLSILRERCREVDLVIVTDFGHGLITPKVIKALTECAPFLAVNAQTNSANTGFNLITRYPRADFICIDAPEARLAVADKHIEIERLVSEILPQRIACPRLIVTNGRHGCVTFGPDELVVHIPAFTKTVVDTVGAGDAFFAVTAPLVAAGATMAEAGFIGNVAGALKVGIVGHRKSVEKGAVLKYLQTLLK